MERAERDQDADYARIHAAIHAAERSLTALAGRQLCPDEKRKEWCAIRDRTILAVRHVRHNIIKRAKDAKQTERWMMEKWLRQVNDGRILREFTADVEKVPTTRLLDYLRYLIQYGDLARIQSVSTVFGSRQDNRPYKAAFDKMLGQFTLSQCRPLGDRIARICFLAENMDIKIVNQFAHCATKRLCSSTQSPPRIEAPSISALDVDATVSGEPGGAMQLLLGPSDQHLSRPVNCAMGSIPMIKEIQLPLAAVQQD